MSLVGCSTVVSDFDSSLDRTSGEWTLEGPEYDASVDLQDDGSFVATDWPADLCELPRPTGLTSFEWNRPRSFSGTWEVFPELTNAGYLSVKTGECDSVAVYFQVEKDTGTRSMRIYLLTDEARAEESAVDFIRIR